MQISERGQVTIPKELRAQFGQAGKKRLENVFSLGHMTKAHYNLYQEILSAP